MKKDFITVTPDSGSSNETVNVTADPNTLYKERETTLNFSASGGISNAVNITQQPIPYFLCIGLNYQVDDPSGPFNILSIVPLNVEVTNDGRITQFYHLKSSNLGSGSAYANLNWYVNWRLTCLSSIEASRIKVKIQTEKDQSYREMKLNVLETQNEYTVYGNSELYPSESEIPSPNSQDLYIALEIDGVNVIEYFYTMVN